jgi:HSP20 family protein
MLTRFGDFEPSFVLFDELRRRMDTIWDDFDTQHAAFDPRGLATWPTLRLDDAGANFVVTADVPGLTEKEIEITLDGDTLTLKGERKDAAPEGYATHRKERGAWKIARAISLPAKVDPEKTNASFKDGVLTVTLAKAPEARPRQIAVTAK